MMKVSLRGGPLDGQRLTYGGVFGRYLHLRAGEDPKVYVYDMLTGQFVRELTLDTKPTD